MTWDKAAPCTSLIQRGWVKCGRHIWVECIQLCSWLRFPFPYSVIYWGNPYFRCFLLQGVFTVAPLSWFWGFGSSQQNKERKRNISLEWEPLFQFCFCFFKGTTASKMGIWGCARCKAMEQIVLFWFCDGKRRQGGRPYCQAESSSPRSTQPWRV